MAGSSNAQDAVSEGASLAWQIRISYIVAAVIAGVIIGTYVVAMVGFYKLRGMGDPAAWGQFGDYFGGLLNPIIAGLAFYWLTQSVRIQQAEMTESRIALQESSGALIRQVDAAERTAEINGLSGLLAFYSANLSRLTQEAGRLDQALFELGRVEGKKSFFIFEQMDRETLQKDFRKVTAAIEETRAEAQSTLEDLRSRLMPMQKGDSGAAAAAPSTG